MRSLLFGWAAPLLVVLAALTQPARLPAQEHDHQHRIGRLGRVVFPVSCNPAAQKSFEHAMAVLHSFWWEEGNRAFADVIQADSTCAMAYWGMALNAWGNPFAGGPVGPGLAKGAEAAARASALTARTERERGFIAASSALYRNPDSIPNPVRLKAYADTMGRLYRRFPKDVEVAIYYVPAIKNSLPMYSPDGRFVRQQSRFTDWVTADGSSGHRAEPGRYHLYVARACPWSQRTLIVRHLKGLEDVIGVSFTGSRYSGANAATASNPYDDHPMK